MKLLGTIAMANILASATSLAQTTNLTFEASADGGNTWVNHAFTTPNTVVDVRLRVSLVGATALGLSGLTCQPTLSGWNSTNQSVVPFTFPGLDNSGNATTETSYEGRHIAYAPGRSGRVFPFGSASMSSTSAMGLLTSFNDGGGVLRFAGSRATTATTNPAWGVVSTQLPPSLGGTNFVGSSSVVVFVYRVNVGPVTSELMTGLVNVSQNRAVWYLNTSGSQTLNATIGTTTNAIISVAPCPSIFVQPHATSVCAVAPGVGRTTATFTTATSTPGAVTYQWRRNTVPLVDSPGHIYGATSRSLAIVNAVNGDAGSYDCVLSGACGSNTTQAATLTVNSCCPVDLDNGSRTGTGDLGVDINDLLYFLEHFEGGC